MSKVVIYTQAYNAEKTVRRTIESVLNQTYSDLIYVILDNGSTDKTGNIIAEYAKQDSRIVTFRNEINNVFKEDASLQRYLEQFNNDCYYSVLDADDEYNPDFLKKILLFMQEYHLEIAACGSDFIDTGTGNIQLRRKVAQNLILEGEGFNKFFPIYHAFMRTLWGKVYTFSTLRKPSYKSYTVGYYGTDTLLTLKNFYNASRVGILAESLHKYYLSPKSVSYQFDSNRIVSDQILFDAARDYLIYKCGRVSPRNLSFLFAVHLNALRDTTNVLLGAHIDSIEKLKGLRDIFTDQRAQDLQQMQTQEYGFSAIKEELYNNIVRWVLSQRETRNGEGMEIAADLFAAIGVYPVQIDGWHDCRVFTLLSKIRDKLPDTESAASVDGQIVSIASKEPLLSGWDAGILTFFHEIIFSILRHDEPKALKQIKDTISEEWDIPDEYVIPLLTLGLNLSALQKQTKDFVYFKKLQISCLIDLSEVEEARKQLADWDRVLPDDPDLRQFRARLMQ